LRRTCTASPLTRQAIFMAIARWHACDRADADTTEVALLRDGRAADIIKGRCGSVPHGLLGALERVGSQWLSSPEAYDRLWTIYTDPDRRAANALQYVGQITDRTLRVIEVLDPLLLHAEVLKRIDSRAQAVDLNRAVSLLRAASSQVTDTALSEAFGRMQAPSAIPRLLHRLLRTSDRFPPPPCQGDAELRPLQSARDLIEAARRFRNCLGSPSMIAGAVTGEVAFAEYRGVAEKVICEFRPLSGGKGWLLSDVHGERNEPVRGETREAAQEKCARFGIPHVRAVSPPEWRSLRRLIHGTGMLNWAA
jgi:hypothetical protein